MTVFSILPVESDPVWPWNIPFWGELALWTIAAIMVLATLWTYLRVPTLGLTRVSIILGIRILALALIFLSLAGTSCISQKDYDMPSLVLVGVDSSASMSLVRDETDNLSRWEYLKRTLDDNKTLIEELQNDHNIKLLFFRFGRQVAPFDINEPGLADEKRTNTAQLMKTLYTKYRNDPHVRSVLILSDGADNASLGKNEKSASDWASDWKNAKVPVFTFLFGNPNTPDHEKDIILERLTIPSEVASKGKLRITANVQALGFVGRPVRVKVLFDDKEVMAETKVLRREEKNEITLETTAPPTPGEIKVTVQIHDPSKPDALPGELSAANNEQSSFVTVTKEGISVLVVERQERFPEVQQMLPVLEKSSRINVYRVYLRGKVELAQGQTDLLDLERRPYDVLILGEVTANQLMDADPRILDRIADRVENQGMGLLMLGSRYAFGNPDEQGRRNWIGTKMEEILPLDLQQARGQNTRSIRLVPTEEGLEYLLQLDDDPKRTKDLWNDLEEMNGMSKLGMVNDPRFTIRAKTQDGDPLMVTRDYGKGRVMAFGADTTHYWIRDVEGEKAHTRFWQRLAIWLAHQENLSDQLKIRPEKRRLAVGDPLNFSLSLFDKQSNQVPNVNYTAKIIHAKSNKEYPIALPSSGTETTSEFVPPEPGEYRIEAIGKGTSKKGEEIESKSSVRFLAYQDDAESVSRAANDDFLRNLANAGDGLMRRPQELEKYLRSLPKKEAPKKTEEEKWPDWRTSESPSPFLIGFLLFFVHLLALEWFLRRKWGLT